MNRELDSSEAASFKDGKIARLFSSYFIMSLFVHTLYLPKQQHMLLTAFPSSVGGGQISANFFRRTLIVGKKLFPVFNSFVSDCT